MPIVNKTKRTAAIYNRGREVVKVYDHGKLAWQKQSSIPDYLCFTALEAGQFTLTIPAAVTATYLSYVEWSKDGRTWNHRDNTSEAVTIDVQVAQGDKVYWRGRGQRMSYSANSGYTSGFSSTCNFSVSGHLVSILKGDDFENTSFANATFARLFENCDYLASAEDLVLPSFTTTTYVFASMFLRCTALVSAPELPPVTNLTTGCYYQMFFGCSSLNHVKCLATDISATNCLYNWLNSVSSTGTFIQAEGVEWPRGASGIPTGWVDVEKRTMPSGYKQVEYLSNPNYGYININRAFESNAETLEIAFVKQSSGASFFIGNPTYNYRYGSIKVIEQATALLTRVGVDYANALYKDSSIASVSANLPYTLRYAGSASGFGIYLDGVLKKTETCAWDAVNPYEDNLLFSSNTNSANTAYFHVLPVYYLKIWDGNGVLALDYVAAVRESDGVAGFYDMAANTFHKSDNANDFTAGEEI